MRKKNRRRIASSKSPNKRVLQLSKETVRALTSKELSQAVGGCPTGSSPTTLEQDTTTCPV
jgi:hypothetical protein